jgi:hypothetical protein
MIFRGHHKGCAGSPLTCLFAFGNMKPFLLKEPKEKSILIVSQGISKSCRRLTLKVCWVSPGSGNLQLSPLYDIFETQTFQHFFIPVAGMLDNI